jgi:hypothetical protein
MQDLSINFFYGKHSISERNANIVASLPEDVDATSVPGSVTIRKMSSGNVNLETTSSEGTNATTSTPINADVATNLQVSAFNSTKATPKSIDAMNNSQESVSVTMRGNSPVNLSESKESSDEKDCQRKESVEL